MIGQIKRCGRGKIGKSPTQCHKTQNIINEINDGEKKGTN